MADQGKITVGPGDQASIALGFSPDAVKIENSDNGKNTTIRYAWIYNDGSLISTPETSPDTDVEINPGGARTLKPLQKNETNPSTFVFYNEGPGNCIISKL